MDRAAIPSQALLLLENSASAEQERRCHMGTNTAEEELQSLLTELCGDGKFTLK